MKMTKIETKEGNMKMKRELYAVYEVTSSWDLEVLDIDLNEAYRFWVESNILRVEMEKGSEIEKYLPSKSIVDEDLNIYFPSRLMIDNGDGTGTELVPVEEKSELTPSEIFDGLERGYLH